MVIDREPSRRLEKNVSGPFYTTGDCLACAAPEYEAPDLLARWRVRTRHLFVRQPKTPREVGQACRALEVCCVAALRYGGTKRAIIRRLGNHPLYCDYLLPGDGGRVRIGWVSNIKQRAGRGRSIGGSSGGIDKVRAVRISKWQRVGNYRALVSR